MNLLSSIKAGLSRTADLYSKQACPWEKFDRPCLPLTLRDLSERESECWSDLQSFWFFKEILAHHIPQDRVPPLLDTGDQAIWQGIYAAMLAFKYARAKSDVLAQYIADALSGMYQHQHFHGEGKPRLIRGYDRRAGNIWQDDASNDSLTGHFAGLYFIFRFGPIEARARALQMMSGIASELIENNLCLVKADGTPTTYGKLINGVLTEPLQMTLVLAILTVAERYGLHGLASKYRDEIYSTYGPMIPYPKTILGTLENWNDDHRAALHLAILAMEDTSPHMQDLVRRGLLRLWAMLKDRANIWVNGLIALGLGDTIPADVKAEMTRQATLILSEYELTEKRWNTEVSCTGTFDGKLYPGKTIIAVNHVSWLPRIITIAGQPRATQPLPHWACSKQDFIYQRHRYSVRDWLGVSQPTDRFNGGDFLCAYWVNVLAGILPSPVSSSQTI